jgi:hypothetical protein
MRFRDATATTIVAKVPGEIFASIQRVMLLSVKNSPW